MWRADLSPITRGSGLVDLRIHAEDNDGNDVTLRLEPAFVGSIPPRRRSAAH